MSSLKLSKYAAMGAAAVFAALSDHHAYADAAASAFRFAPFSSSRPAQDSESEGEDDGGGRVRGLDPDALERGAKASREIKNSPYAKQVFELNRKQEQTRLAELEAEKAHNKAIQVQLDIERLRKLAEEQRELRQQEAQTKAQNMRYEDELARKRMQAKPYFVASDSVILFSVLTSILLCCYLQQDHETQRQHNVELVRMQEASALRKEQARQATEKQIQEQLRQTEKERADLELVTLKAKAMAEAEARAKEAKLTEDLNRKMLMESMNGEKEKWLAAINTTFSHIEGGVRELLTDRTKLAMTVGGATALAVGVYTSREGARVTWGYINRILGQPSLIRESSMSKFPLAEIFGGAAKKSNMKNGFQNVVLHPSLEQRVENLARATANTKSHHAPFRNMMFYGPPGTGKTLVAREIAEKSGLDYAMMTGGDVAPLGAQAVTKIHDLFDWAKKSRKGLLLFIDEADAFLCERNSTYMSEAQRSALNAMLFRTGDQSGDIVLVLVTNKPEDIDGAVTNRMDEIIEFPLPGEEERYKLLKLYLSKYLINDNSDKPKPWHFFKKKPQKITIKDISDDMIREAARKTQGFSGRDIAKLMASVQAAVYGRPDCVLDSELFTEIVDYKVDEHHRRQALAIKVTVNNC
ncbi:ATPase family AAA domain-containing protein [Drosera capensis]